MSFIIIFTMGLQFFEPIHTSFKSGGAHPLEVQKLHPIYTWLVCLISYMMLIGVTGLVELYSTIEPEEEETHSDDAVGGSDLADHQNVIGGFAVLIPLVVVLKIVEQEDYRDQLLWARPRAWLQSFYTQAQEAERQEVMETHDPRTQESDDDVETNPPAATDTV